MTNFDIILYIIYAVGGVVLLLTFIGLFVKEKSKEEIGKEYEETVGKHYEKEGYKVEYRGLELGIKDGGIDLIATKDKEMLLIQCKKWGTEKSINHKMIKEFYGNCNFYLDKNYHVYKTHKIHCIYAVHKHSVFHSSALWVFKDNKTKCRYKVVKG